MSGSFANGHKDLMLNYFNFLTFLVFWVGCAGYLVSTYNLLTNFVALEYLFLGSAVMGTSFSLTIDDLEGQVFFLIVLGVAAAEAALGLALLVQFYRLRGDVKTLVYPLIKG